jgi:putative acyl-CoA dehydrogenase
MFTVAATRRGTTRRGRTVGPLSHTGRMPGTHEVANQPPPPFGHDVADDPALLEAVEREGAGWCLDDLHRLGRLAGSEQAWAWAVQAEEHPPVLRSHDRFGHRADEVEYHPAYHELMTVAVREGLHAAPWADPRPGAHVARAARMHVWSQVDAGHTCPVSMTYAAVPVLRHAPELADRLEPLLTAREYDPGLREPSTKRGLVAGMSMTEKQGGSDVRTNTTVAVPAGDGTVRLTGHKWFTSAPMSDLFLTLAQGPEGLSCYLLPRVLPDGDRNRIQLQRLKSKLGNRSNASAELEYDGAVGWPVGPPGRGVATIIDMVNLTRLDCVLGSASGMRYGLVRAVQHTRHRSAFGRLLADQPLMRNVLADLALESEAATLLAIRLAGATERAAAGDETEAAFRRIALPVAKYWVCKRGPGHAAEALECLGGNGYVEDSGMPRLYREAPLLSIWEGSGNVVALDLLRATTHDSQPLNVLMAELEQTAEADPRLEEAVHAFGDYLHAVTTHVAIAAEQGQAQATEELQHHARGMACRAAVLLQAGLMVRHSPSAVAEAFLASRFGREGDVAVPGAYGMLPSGLDLRAVLSRCVPS